MKKKKSRIFWRINSLLALHFIWYYTLSHLKLKYRYTSLGVVWNFLEPALYLGILSLVFSVVNRMNIQDYVVFLFSALIPWRYLERAVNTASESIVTGDWLLKKMYVSPFVFPVIRWLVAGVEYLFSLIILIFFLLLFKEQWTSHLWIVPLAFIPWAILSLGLGMIGAVLYTFFRDIRQIIQLGLMIIFFTSPILFKPEIFQDASLQARILQWNPVTYYAALFQKPVYYLSWPAATDWIVTIGLGLIIFILGASLVYRYRGRFYFYL